VCSGPTVQDCLPVQYETPFDIPTCKCHNLTNHFLGHLSFYRLRWILSKMETTHHTRVATEIGDLFWWSTNVFLSLYNHHHREAPDSTSEITSKQRKAVPLQAWSGPEGSRKLRFPDFVTTAQDGSQISWQRHRMVVRLSALRTGRLYPPEMLLVLISVGGWVDPRVGAVGRTLCECKITMTPAGIEPVTFRFVARHLNHCATAVPRKLHAFFFISF